jgi:hypothetical protein
VTISLIEIDLFNKIQSSKKREYYNHMQPRFITFMQCTFDNKWRHTTGSEAGQEESMAMRNMVLFRSVETDAKINLIDMNLKEVRLQFRTEASVGVGNGMLYCNTVDVIDTHIAGWLLSPVDEEPELDIIFNYGVLLKLFFIAEHFFSSQIWSLSEKYKSNFSATKYISCHTYRA